jgi:hypothetical protein
MFGANVPTFSSTPGCCGGDSGPGLFGCVFVLRSSAPITYSLPKPNPVTGDGGWL